MVFGTAIRLMASRRPKPVSKPIELKTAPEQTQTITRVLFDIVKEHGPLSIGQTWERVQQSGLREVASKQRMKLILKWMKDKHKLKLLCNHIGPNKQFLYATSDTKPDVLPKKPYSKKPAQKPYSKKPAKA